MTFVYKEYEVKIKIVQEQWLQLKMKFLLGYNMKIVKWRGLTFGGVVYWGGFFHVGEEWANFWLVGATSPISPVGKTLTSLESKSNVI